MKGRKINKKRLIVAVAVVLIAAVIIARARQPQPTVSNLQTDTVKRGTVMSSVSGNGVLEPLTTVEVRSNVGGQIVELAVDEGDYVKAGQLIAKIDPSDWVSNLDQARADYTSSDSKVSQAKQAYDMQRIQADASIEEAKQALESSKMALEQAEEEARVQPQLTAESIAQAKSSLASAQATLEQAEKALIPQNLASAKAGYDQAKASYDEAQKNLKRQKALLEKGFVSQSTVDSAESEFENAKAQLESARRKNDTIQTECDQDLADARAKVTQAKSVLKAAEANRIQVTLKQKALASARASYKKAQAALVTAKSSEYQNRMKSEEILQAQASLKKSKAAVDNAVTQLGYTTITAPRSGVIVKKYVEKGSIVTAGGSAIGGSSGSGVTIVDIADTSKMQVVVDVDETDIGKIRLDQEVDVKVDAFSDDPFRGKVTKIAPEAEVNSNVTTVPVTVEIEGTDSRLKPEMNATCDFVVDRKEDVLYVPVEAVVETDNGSFVTVMDKDKQTDCKVQVGLTGDDYCEIISGLKEGQTVTISEEDSSKKSNTNFRRGPGGPPL
jgi:HlyD family secretion protein